MTIFALNVHVVASNATVLLTRLPATRAVAVTWYEPGNNWTGLLTVPYSR